MQIACSGRTEELQRGLRMRFGVEAGERRTGSACGHEGHSAPGTRVVGTRAPHAFMLCSSPPLPHVLTCSHACLPRALPAAPAALQDANVFVSETDPVVDGQPFEHRIVLGAKRQVRFWRVGKVLMLWVGGAGGRGPRDVAGACNKSGGDSLGIPSILPSVSSSWWW